MFPDSEQSRSSPSATEKPPYRTGDASKADRVFYERALCYPSGKANKVCKGCARYRWGHIPARARNVVIDATTIAWASSGCPMFLPPFH